MRAALRYVRPYRAQLGLVVALSLVSTALSLTQPFLSKILVDRALIGRDMGVLTVGERTQPTLPGVEEASIPNETTYAELPLEDQAPSAAIAPPSIPERAAVREQETVLCHICGDIMQRAGSCHACPSCGATSGCS